jgi:glycosyltransferase involved in cell wall biosynthesis
MKIAISILCENPERRTGLTTLFHEFIRHGLKLFPDVRWLIFAGPDQEWVLSDPRIELDRRFPANNHLGRRLFADHFQVPVAARAAGADALMTVGFVPARKTLPTAMQVFSLQHLDRQNRTGLARELYRRWATRFTWPKADVVITNSQFAATQLLQVHPHFTGKLVQSYEGLQHDLFFPQPAPGETEALQEAFGIAPGYFLWISNFYPYKQADLLLRAYATLPAAVRERRPLVMSGGEWEGQREAAKSLTETLGIAANVKFLGWIDDRWLGPLYRHARAFCLPSREETFGRCVIEAMACGAPSVVNDIPVMREITGEHALIVDYRDTARVASALEKLDADGAQHAEWRRRGLEWTKQFSFERLCQERVAAVRRIVKLRAES